MFCLVLFWNLAINNPTKRKIKLGIGSVINWGKGGSGDQHIYKCAVVGLGVLATFLARLMLLDY